MVTDTATVTVRVNRPLVLGPIYVSVVQSVNTRFYSNTKEALQFICMELKNVSIATRGSFTVYL